MRQLSSYLWHTRRFLFSLLCLASSTTYLPAQLVWDWARQPDTINLSAGLYITVDEVGNRYILGAFTGRKFAFDGDTIFNTDQISPNNFSDGFLLKIDSLGNSIWIKSIGGFFDDAPNGIALDLEGNILVCGSLAYQYFVIDNDSVIVPAGTNSYLLKLNSEGGLLWQNFWNSQSIQGIDIDSQNNILIGGSFTEDTLLVGSEMIFNCTPNVSYNPDLFLAQFDADGTLNWLWGTGTEESEYIESLVIDKNDDIILGGILFQGSPIFFDSIPLAVTPQGISDPFLAKFNSNGEVLWAKTSPGDNGASIDNLIVDSENNIYFSGWMRDSARSFGDFEVISNGFLDFFVGKASPLGEFQWIQSGGGQDMDVPRAIAIDDLNQVYVLGKSASGRIEFDTIVIDTTVPQALDHYNLFIAKYDEDGNILNAAVPFVDLYIGYYLDIARLPNSSSLMLTGSFTSSMAFGSDTVRSDSECAFIAKLHAFLPDVKPDEPSHGEPIVLIYPNPATDQLNITWVNLSEAVNVFSVFDLLGRKIREVEIDGTNGSLLLNVESLSASAYIIRIRSLAGENIITHKFLKL